MQPCHGVKLCILFYLILNANNSESTVLPHTTKIALEMLMFGRSSGMEDQRKQSFNLCFLRWCHWPQRGHISVVRGLSRAGRGGSRHCSSATCVAVAAATTTVAWCCHCCYCEASLSATMRWLLLYKLVFNGII